ncbi:MAG: hypothetical protein COV67_00765 [Nitrospinae bacterium CG11_big_fil_rev_8_21_14_0_20_56_8]|nr:MAG: hypothetical protein COV67_00765 [Nitrospinae bacterium CG11_big_fil_rev_8_21_14_0_20_56_8]
MFTIKEYRKGKYIIRQGTHGTSAFILKKGSVEVFREDAGGNKIPIAVLKEGDVFGEMAMISDTPRTANVVTLDDCQVAVLTKEAFLNLPDNNPAVVRIKKVMIDRLKGIKSSSR